MISVHAFGRSFYAIEPTATYITILVLNFVLCLPVVFAVGIFSLYHFWLLATNTTTIESWEKEKVATLKRRGRVQDIKYPYHLGVLRNIKAVLGARPLCWLWPQEMSGDGLSFDISASIDASEQYNWPPRDTTEHLDHVISVRPSRLTGGRSKRITVPPYHVHYNQSPSASSSTDGDSDELPVLSLARKRYQPRVRRGSEGLEVRPMSVDDRNAIVQAYEESLDLPFD